MDNLTHSLFGVALAEAAYQIVRRRNPKEKPPSRRPFFYGSVIANNFPDVDLIVRLFDSSPLSYLVHHRGWTHTLAWAPAQALLVFLMICWGQKHKPMLFLVCLVGLITHMFLDYQNSYGIHMFSPFDHHWMYGDTLFIVEPSLWVPILALGFLTWTSRTINIVLFLCFLLVQAMGFRMGLTNLLSFSSLLALLIAAYLVLRELKPFARSISTVISMLLVILLFRVHKGRAAETITSELSRQNVTPLIDLVLSPMPTHPTCWTFFAVSLNKDDYRVDAGIQGFNCPAWTRMELGLPKGELMPAPGFQWVGTYKSSASHITKDYDLDCRIKTIFQFLRVPARDNEVLSDLRFGGNRSFSALFLNEKMECPKFPTPWIPPRQDLLNLK